MQRLKMLTKGPNGNYRRGQVVEVDDQRAAILIEGKHAIDANQPLPEPEEVSGGDVDTEGL